MTDNSGAGVIESRAPGTEPHKGRRDTESTRTVERAIQVLTALARDSVPAGVTELSNATGLPKSSINRLLQSLESRGLVCRVGKKYRLGPGLLLLSLGVQERLVVRAEANPYLHRLRNLTGETASLHLSFADNSLLVARAISLHNEKSLPEPGRPLPLHLRPAGRVMLALWPQEAIKAYVQKHVPQGTRGLVDAHLRVVATQGYDLEDDGQEVEVAFPLVNFNEMVLGSIAITGPRDRWTPETVESLLDEMKAEVADLARSLRYLEPLRLD